MIFLVRECKLLDEKCILLYFQWLYSGILDLGSSQLSALWLVRAFWAVPEILGTISKVVSNS